MGERMGRPTGVALILASVALMAVLAVGCGGNTNAAKSTTTAAAKPPPVHVASTPIERLRRQIQAAGIGGVNVFYAGSDKARTEEAEIVNLMDNRPSNGLAYVHDQIVAWTANQNGLTNKERAEFEEVEKLMNSLP